MYCEYCGKQIPQDATICPYCGKKVSPLVDTTVDQLVQQTVAVDEQPIKQTIIQKPVVQEPVAQVDAVEKVQEQPAPKAQPKPPVNRSERPFPLEIITLFLSGLAFFTSLIFGSLMMSRYSAMLFIYLLPFMTVVPALVGICSSIYTLYRKDGAKLRVMAIISMSLSAFALFFIFVAVCV